MPYYDKLVRDRIPEIIQKKGETPVVHVADEAEYRRRLKTKLQEETEEFFAAENLEELADVLEVVYALRDLLTQNPKELEKVRLQKRKERGGFEGRIVLEETSP
ncbi:MAG TPA: nucleoside triphosphate pyrophosphohydrolase [Patescibacteria group bacterium]|nr:nucleoside triphosphate pyrophosphohydrolase [Patescibacteria group bacterium]